MRFFINIFSLLLLNANCINTAMAQVEIPLINYVNPITGTAPSTTLSAKLHGEGTEQFANTIPAVTLPFAMTQWTPQTNSSEQKCIAPYYYDKTSFSGIRGSHWLSGGCTQDYGSFTIMPITGKLETSLEQYQADFSHNQEISTPAYYGLTLDKYRLKVEVTATLRCAIIQFTALADDSLYILVIPNSDFNQGYVRINKKEREVIGYNPVHRIYQGKGNLAGFNGYFVVQLMDSFDKAGVFSNNEIFELDSIKNRKQVGAYIGLKVKKGSVICLKIGTSFSSIKEARNNLEAEINEKNFESVKDSAVLEWNKMLGQIVVETDNIKNKRIFYTAMYHAMQLPRLYSDHSGTYPRFAGNYQIEKLENGNYYDDFSMWDIYRAQLPLLEILKPTLINDLVKSLIIKSEQGGWLPNFPCWNSYTSAMIGDHGTAFISSAFIKGIRGYDIQAAYKVMRKNAFEIPDLSSYKDGKGRRSLTSYIKYGYYPLEDEILDAFHVKEQTSRTMEYAFDDYSLSLVAKKLGYQDDFEILKQRGNNYKNVFDKRVGFVNGRYANGRWYQNFDPDKKVSLSSDKINFITEGTPRQYTFSVNQDIPSLARLLGGMKELEIELDSLFIKKQYWHGNEPGHHIPFLYNYTKAPYKTQLQVNKILTEEYSDGPGGLGGNDDAGQMSAWYIFSSMGFYPVNPVSTKYALTTPLFNKVTIYLPNGKFFKIVNSNPQGLVIKKISVNGFNNKSYFINHKLFVKGGIIKISTIKNP